jgi:hypothetical protein
MTIEIRHTVDTPVCTFVYYKDEEGKDMAVCRFKSVDHPVNKKAGLFKMSGAEQE